VFAPAVGSIAFSSMFGHMCVSPLSRVLALVLHIALLAVLNPLLMALVYNSQVANAQHMYQVAHSSLCKPLTLNPARRLHPPSKDTSEAHPKVVKTVKEHSATATRLLSLLCASPLGSLSTALSCRV
jgi:hypothetical protein